MPLITRQPTANETPDTGQGGLAVTGNTNTGHGSTGVVGVGSGSQLKTCRWFNFQSVAGQITGIRLKLNWSESGSIVPVSGSSFAIDYSLNNGSSWNNIISHVSVTAPNSGSEDVNIVPQDITQIQVRDTLNAFDINGGQADLTASVSDIRLEIQIADSTPIPMM